MKTTVDWLRFRAKEEPVQILEALRPMYGDRAGDLHLLPGVPARAHFPIS